MAVLRHSGTREKTALFRRKAEKTDPVVTAFLKDVLTDYDPAHVTVYNGNPVYFTPAMDIPPRAAFSCGVTIGEVRKNYLQPHHQFFMAMGHLFRRKIDLPPESDTLERYLRGEEIDAACENGWAVITTAGCTVGGVKVVGGRAKNHYPKGLRKV